jgi:AcrR family transcriptional regulator
LTQKVEEIEDLRVQRTRKLLQRAIMELVVEKGFAALTVRDIAERAMVNRSTFYRHYLDKYDWLEKYLDEVFDLINIPEAIPETNTEARQAPDESAQVVPVGLLNLLKHVQTVADFYRVMLGPQGDPLFIQRFSLNLERRHRYLISVSEGVAAPEPDTPPIDLRLSYVSKAGIGAIIWWLENDQACSAEQLALWMGRFSKTVLKLKM